MKKKNKAILISDVVISVLFLITAIFCLSIYLTYPYPERTKIEDMDYLMIYNGEAFALMTYVFCIPFMIAYYIVSEALTIALYTRMFITRTGLYHHISDKKVNRVWFYIGSALSFVGAPVFIWTVVYKLFKMVLGASDVRIFRTRKRTKFWKNLIILPLAISYPVAAISAVIFVERYPLFYYNQIPLRQKDLKEAYTLSEDKQNTMVIFYDRAFNTHVSKLFALDYIFFNKENGIINKNGTSFVELFPEFKYFINSLSSGDVTNVSVSSITGTWNYSAPVKSVNFNNPFLNKNNDEIGQSEWLEQAHASSMNMLKENGYNNFGMVAYPYYGNLTWQHNTNSAELQEQLRKDVGTNNINVFDQTEASRQLSSEVYFSPFDDMKISQTLCANKKSVKGIVNNGNIEFAPSDLNASYANNPYGANEDLKLKDNPDNINVTVKPQRESSYLMFHSGVTHQKYVHISNKKFVNNMNIAGINYDNPSDGEMEYCDAREGLKMVPKEDIFFSEWFMIQKFKDMLIYLKNLPYTGPDKFIKNQYDNTNIYFISDHGNLITDDLKSVDFKVADVLQQHNLITQQELDDYKKNIMNTEIMQKCSALFIRKPRKQAADKDTSITPTGYYPNNIDYLKNFYDKKTFINVADLMPVVEADVKKANGQAFNDADSFYVKNSYLKANPNMNEQLQKAYNTLIKDTLIPNPLENLDKLRTRKEFLSYAYNWRHIPNKKEFELQRIYLVDQSKLSTQSSLKDCYLNEDIYKEIWRR